LGSSDSVEGIICLAFEKTRRSRWDDVAMMIMLGVVAQLKNATQLIGLERLGGNHVSPETSKPSNSRQHLLEVIMN
jgi:hypothetical protein